MKILIIGVNGFVGSSLAKTIINETDWTLFGLDVEEHRLQEIKDNPRLNFLKGDLRLTRDWISEQIQNCDICLPLAAYATPMMYVEKPLDVFELDFEENLRIVRCCLESDTRVIFPSTSEVYGKCPDTDFVENKSSLVYGPIDKQRWIYASSKQLLERVIWAMGKTQRLRFTIIRLFNWVGPNLDNTNFSKRGESRVVSQFLSNIKQGENIKLVDGGEQRRCFTSIEDGISALMKIIQLPDKCNHQIINLGNPQNDVSIRELALLMLKIAKNFPCLSEKIKKIHLESIPAENYYGDGYEDVLYRVPNINLAHQILQWSPSITLENILLEIFSQEFSI